MCLLGRVLPLVQVLALLQELALALELEQVEAQVPQEKLWAQLWALELVSVQVEVQQELQALVHLNFLVEVLGALHLVVLDLDRALF
jgi:hypothetical protein